MTHYEETMSMVEDFKKAKFSEEQTKVILKAVEKSQKDGLENLATKQDIVDVRSELSDIRMELKEDIHALDIKFTKLEGEISTVKWMAGFSIALSIAILVKLFLP